jgi:hypothetical protein
MLTRPAGIGRLGLLTIKAVTAAYFRGPLAIVQAASEAYDLSGNPRMSRPVGDLARDPTKLKRAAGIGRLCLLNCRAVTGEQFICAIYFSARWQSSRLACN